MGGDDLFVLVLSLLFLGGTALLLRGSRGVPNGETPGARDEAGRHEERERRS